MKDFFIVFLQTIAVICYIIFAVGFDITFHSIWIGIILVLFGVITFTFYLKTILLFFIGICAILIIGIILQYIVDKLE